MTTLFTPKKPVLLMRVRRAHNTRRRTQIQLPITLVNGPSEFFAGVDSIMNQWGTTHKLISARARGVLNTVKVEIPEIEHMIDPVLRLTKTTSGVVTYEAFDSYQGAGRLILETLQEGFKDHTTRSTLRGQSYRATWYKFQTAA